MPGFVDEANGTAVYAANIGWSDVPLRALVAERLGGVPVAVGHDMRTGGLAEARLGSQAAGWTASCSSPSAPGYPPP